jgi:hypothetical protein
MWASQALSTESTGGLQIIIGSATNAYKHFYIKGSDTFFYGGWQCIPVDPSLASSTQSGSPTTARQYFGVLANVVGSVSKGQSLGIDAIRYGSSITVSNGDIANPATLEGI